jgi:NAD(P)-dependent dehydrogenase (short-subunit alcohol dehydrogenase family)
VLHEQVVIVTGASRGIGRSIALRLAAEGAAVVLAARSAPELGEVAGQITAAGGRALAVPGDVTEPAAVEALVAAATGRFGGVTALINNAGLISAVGPVWATDLAAWRGDLEVNLFGPINCIRAVMPGLIAAGGGRIVNISSMAAGWRMPYATSYSCGKAAMLRLTESMAVEAAEFGIAVFAMAPGLVRTALSDALRTTEAMTYMDRRGYAVSTSFVDPAAAAGLAARLVSGAADRLTGRFLTVDDDLDELVAAADDIERRDLLTLRLEGLHGRVRSGGRGPS